MFTFLHAADIHLDSPLRGLDKYEGAPVDDIRNATRRALENLVKTAIDEKVSFVVIAGDLYDGDWRDFHTGLYFASQMVRLKDAGIPVFAVTGNHDAANRMTKSLPLPGNVKLFSTKHPETALLDDIDVAIHGQSFANQCTTVDLAKDYPPPTAGSFNIGVLHTSLSGREGHDSYAPCSEECLRAKGYDYWALGHVHAREIVSTDPTIAFPGNIQGRHIRERNAKGCLSVTVSNNRQVSVEFRPLDVLRWEHVKIDLSDVHDNPELIEKVSAKVREVQQSADGLPLALRLDLVGQSPVHRLLIADTRQATNEIRSLTTELGSGNIWLEKLNIRTTPVPTKTSSGAAVDGPLAEIGTLVQELRFSPAKLSELGAEFADLMRKLPPELNEAIRPTDDEWLSRVLDEVESRLMTRLGG